MGLFMSKSNGRFSHEFTYLATSAGTGCTQALHTFSLLLTETGGLSVFRYVTLLTPL